MRSAGTQFSSEYVREFAELVSRPRPELEAELLNRWIARFSTDAIPGLYGPGNPCGGMTESSLMSSSGAIQNLVDTVFHRRLLDTLADAAIYLDAGGQILHWNRAAERMSGRGAASLLHRAWSSELMGLADDSGQPLNNERCLLRTVTATHTQSNLRLQVMREDGHHFKVHATVIPVFSKAREFTGAILLIRDASAQANLEERVQTLNAIACSDPLTKVANRAALNQRLVDFVRLHLESGERGSIIMCDIDFFKRINDNHGHQAGDEALVTFANLLRESARDDDFVARYGGEEFVILCDQCDNPAATTLAEEMRRTVESTPVPALDGKTMTCSFGVTEVQDGDSEETLLARADRALLMAKEGGRNRVVQLGAGMDEHAVKSSSDKKLVSEQLKANWLGWFRSEKAMVEREYLASVPEAVAIEKLKGFIADHQAEVLSATESHVSIRIDGQNSEGVRRRGERAAIIMLDVHLQSVQVCANGRSKTYQNRTKFTVSARPVKSRDRRTAFLMGQINQILHSFQAYLVAQAIDSELKANIIEPR